MHDASGLGLDQGLDVGRLRSMSGLIRSAIEGSIPGNSAPSVSSVAASPRAATVIEPLIVIGPSWIVVRMARSGSNPVISTVPSVGGSNRCSDVEARFPVRSGPP